MLINIWYIISAIIGIIMGIGSFVLILIGMLFVLGIFYSIIEGDFYEIPFILGAIAFCIIFCSITYFINTKVTQDTKIVSTEINNIISYKGIANVKEGKYNYDNMYFEQGTENDCSILKLDPDRCRIHYTKDKNIKIIKREIEYTSPFRYLGIFEIIEDNISYDVYLPKE